MNQETETGSATAEPNWKEIYKWATNMGLKLMRNEYWAAELASAAVARLFEKWENYRDRPAVEFKAIAGTILYRTMLRVLRYEKAKGDRLYSLDFVIDENEAVHNGLRYMTESRCFDEDSNSKLATIEGNADLMVEFAPFLKALTPSEVIVLSERVDNPSSTSQEVAEWTGFRTASAVRQHEMNIRNKAKSFVSSNPNKSDWQLYLSSERTR
ncbi:MAG: hypothetical protein IPK53_12035 [bacterium]|nr:hypothetical protein [bacterium]